MGASRIEQLSRISMNLLKAVECSRYQAQR
jgi:hypothetical protein